MPRLLAALLLLGVLGCGGRTPVGGTPRAGSPCYHPQRVCLESGIALSCEFGLFTMICEGCTEDERTVTCPAQSCLQVGDAGPSCTKGSVTLPKAGSGL